MMIQEGWLHYPQADPSRRSLHRSLVFHPNHQYLQQALRQSFPDEYGAARWRLSQHGHREISLSPDPSHGPDPHGYPRDRLSHVRL